MTGIKLAGIINTYAAITNAHVRAMLFGLRCRNSEPHRVHFIFCAAGGG